MHKRFYVYITADSDHSVLYIGVTNDINRRAMEHLLGKDKSSFTFRYRCNKLVYYEEFVDINQAIAREKQLKGWRRAYKNDLVESINPKWVDLMVDSIDD